MEIPSYAQRIIDRLLQNGHEAYVVGGSLRDILIGRTPYDFDVTTSATPEVVLSLFSDMKTIPTGLHHGTVTVMCEGNPIEVTTFRTDGKYLDSRHPEKVSFTRNIKEDLARRDFTVNAIAYNKNRGFVDPFGGSDDIKNKILRAVGKAEERMKEDALRIMRAFRFSAQLGFSIEEDTAKALVSEQAGLANISRERIGAETLKLVCAPFPEKPLQSIFETGISKYIFGDYLPSEKNISSLCLVPSTPEARFSCLLWGCESTQADEILSSLKYSNALKNSVLDLISAKDIDSPGSDADLRRFIIRFGQASGIAALLRGIFCQEERPRKEDLERIKNTEFCKSIGELAVDGNDLCRLGLQGKKIGEALSLLFELVTDTPENNNKDFLIEYISNHKDF